MKRLIYLAILLMSLAWFTSCRSIQYVPVETVRTEYKTRDSIRHDSIYQRDSTYLVIKGDTVYKYKEKYLYKYLYLNRTDTVIKTDSVQVPYPVVTEKKLTWWQSIKMELGGWAFGGVLVCLVAVGWLIYCSRRKKIV